MLNNYRRFDGENRYAHMHDNSGLDEIRNRDLHAQQGSTQLRERLEKAIFKFGWRHNITTEEARHLLLNTGLAYQR